MAAGFLNDQFGFQVTGHRDPLAIGGDRVVFGDDHGCPADLGAHLGVIRAGQDEVSQGRVLWQWSVKGADQQQADVVEVVAGDEADRGQAAETVGDQGQAVLDWNLVVNGLVPSLPLGIEGRWQPKAVELDLRGGRCFQPGKPVIVARRGAVNQVSIGHHHHSFRALL